MIRGQTQRGVTLIELVVYIALFSLIIGGAVVAAYQIFESSGRSQTHAMVQEEGDFLLAKISWALSGIQTITAPALPSTGQACSTSNTLAITKWDTSIGAIVINTSGSDITLIRGAGAPSSLNNSNVSVSNLQFKYCYLGGNNPASIASSFTLRSRAPGGIPVTQDFFITTYVRK